MISAVEGKEACRKGETWCARKSGTRVVHIARILATEEAAVAANKELEKKKKPAGKTKGTELILFRLRL